MLTIDLIDIQQQNNKDFFFLFLMNRHECQVLQIFNIQCSTFNVSTGKIAEPNNDDGVMFIYVKKAENLIYSHGYSSENHIVNGTIKCIHVLKPKNSRQS